MPTVARIGSGISLVAREREMTRLRSALERAASGTASAVLLAGDAGVGKTRLVDELAASSADTLVLTGRCLDIGETGIAYLPFAEVLSQVRDKGLLDIAARPALARLLPELALPEHDHSRDSSNPPAYLIGRRPEQDVGQLQLFDAVHGLLGELAERGPVLLVVEDLHWADASTRYLLSFLVSRLRSQRLLVVGTYRSDDLHRSHPLRPLLTELVRQPAVERIQLNPFDKADSHAFVAALADGLPDDVLVEVAERSEGNAFFAEELIATATCSPGGVPAALADVLLDRIERLSPAAQHLLKVASVGGRRVSHARLSRVAGVDDIVLDEALREAVQFHVLLVGDGDEIYTFRHALLREAVYADLLPGERVRMHAAYARMLAESKGDRGNAAALAHHSLESHDLATALWASVGAAKETLRVGAPAESLRFYEQALKLWEAVPSDQRPPGLTELKLLRKASWAAGTAGQPERAVAFARSGTKIADPSDPEEAAEVWRRFAQALQVLDGTEVEKNQAIEQAWQLVRDRPASASRAWVLAVWASSLRYERKHAMARERAEMAVSDGRASGTEAVVADGLATLGLLDEADNNIDRAREHLTDAITCAMEADAVNTELRARHFLGMHYYDLGDLAEAGRAYEEALVRAKATGMAWSSYGLEVRIMQVLVCYYTGNWAEAECAAEPPGLRVSNTVSARLAAAGTHVTVSRGKFDEAERLMAELRAEWHRDLQIALITGGTGAELASWRGRPEQTVERVADTIAWSRQAGGDWLLSGIRLGALGVSGYADLAAKARRKRDAEAERTAVEEGHKLADYARATAEHGVPRTGKLGPEGQAWLARVEAEESRLGGHGDPELWRRAAGGFGYGSVYEQAICRWRLGEALLGADLRDEAATELRAAEEVARELGAVPLLHAVGQAARRGRIPLQAGSTEVVRDHVDPFTPRERTVLALVALGRTNREVGEELYISEKTVSVHLTRIMAKLGAGRRAEAVAIAYDRGLLEQQP
jgi:DNA-binding CsgD family transcriptional regulator